MKKLILLIVIHSFVFNVHAQVKIGAPGNPDINAVLELAGSSKGLLLPRLALTHSNDPDPLSAFTAGMVIYNTANVSNVQPGYYYSDGFMWRRIPSSLETWNLGGNAGTTPSVQFLGTTDPTDLSIRVNNFERVRITTAGAVEIGISSPIMARLKLGGINVNQDGGTASVIYIGGTITNGASNTTLFSIRNAPTFNLNFTPTRVIGTSTSLSYSDPAPIGLLAAEEGTVSTSGSNNYNEVAGVFGFAQRTSSGTTEGSYFGGSFGSRVTSSGSGGVNEVVAILGNAIVDGTGSPAIGNLGGLQNSITSSSPNSSISIIYGVKNQINHDVTSTVPNVYGLQNIFEVSSGGLFTDCYGTYTSFQPPTGSIFRAYGHYVAPITAAGVTNYRGILIGNILAGGGTRRAFEYDGTGTNDPVIINYDGSVQIGTLTPVINAKLTIFDGHLQSGQTTKPTIAATANIGTGGTATLNDATDMAGIITIDLGTGNWNAGNIATVTFNKAYVNTPIVILTPSNGNSALAMINQLPFVTTTATSFTISFVLAATNGAVLTFNYHVIETQNN